MRFYSWIGRSDSIGSRWCSCSAGDRESCFARMEMKEVGSGILLCSLSNIYGAFGPSCGIDSVACSLLVIVAFETLIDGTSE